MNKFRYIALIGIACIIGCGTANRIPFPMPTPQRTVELRPPVIKHDTVYREHARMTAAELQTFVAPLLKANYDNFFAPEFKRMNTAIEAQQSTILTQANSIKLLSDIMAEMRKRSIRRIDSSNNAYKKLQDIYYSEQKKQVHTNAVQINNLKDITNVLLAAGVFMFLVILAMAGLVKIQGKRINKLYQSLANA